MTQHTTNVERRCSAKKRRSQEGRQESSSSFLFTLLLLRKTAALRHIFEYLGAFQNTMYSVVFAEHLLFTLVLCHGFELPGYVYIVRT